MLKARVGRAITGDRRPNKVIAKKKVGTVGRAITGDRATKMSKFSKNDINVANRLMNAGMLSKKNFATLKSRLTKEGKKLVKNKN
jgi:glucose dehydrogenase